MKGLPNWVISGGYSLSYRAFVFLFGFGTYVLLTRYFSIEQFGVWALFILVTSLIELARTSFLQNAFIKFYNDPEADRDALFSSSLLLNFVSTLVMVVGLIIAVPFLEDFWHTEAIGPMIYWYCGGSIVLVFFTQLNFLEQANHRFKGVFWSNVARQGLMFGSVIICFLFFSGLSLTVFSFFYFCATIVGLFVSVMVTREFLPRTYRIYPAYLKKLANFGRYTLGTGATSSIGKYFDQFLLGSISLGSVALFNSCVRIINMFEIPVSSISNVSYPKLAAVNYKQSPQELARLYEKTVAIILAAILPFAIVVFAVPELVLLVTAGEKYLSVAGPLRLMTLFCVLIPFNVQFGNVCEVMNKPHVGFRVNLIANLANAGLNLHFIKTYGAQGAAYVFCFTLLLIFVIGQAYLNKHINISIKSVIIETFRFYKTAFVFVKNKINSRSTNA